MTNTTRALPLKHKCTHCGDYQEKKGGHTYCATITTNTQEELDQMETEAYADLAVEDWELPQGQSVQELAEAHLQAELERNHKYLFDAKYAL